MKYIFFKRQIQFNLMSTATITVEMYSEKAIVVRGTMEHHGTVYQSMGGTFNDRLKGGRGWIFPKHMMNQVRSISDKLNSGQYGNEYEQKSGTGNATGTGNGNGTGNGQEYVSKTEYLSVLSRVERLEALVSQLTGNGSPSSVPSSSSVPSLPYSSSSDAQVPLISLSKPKRTYTKKAPEPEIDFDEAEQDIPTGPLKRLTTVKK